MSDVIFIAVMIAFFVLCALYVSVCDRMIGPDELTTIGQGTDAIPENGSATVTSTSALIEGGVTA